jgi:hypothetical protein
MGHGREMGVIECQSAGTHRVDERGIQTIEPYAPAYHGCIGRTVELREVVQHELNVIFPRASGSTTDPIILSPRKHRSVKNLSPELLNETTSRLVAEFRPEKVILFGSHAWGEPGEDSDVDLRGNVFLDCQSGSY